MFAMMFESNNLKFDAVNADKSLFQCIRDISHQFCSNWPVKMTGWSGDSPSSSINSRHRFSSNLGGGYRWVHGAGTFKKCSTIHRALCCSSMFGGGGGGVPLS
eukprot:3856098-Amphidinium_carterae.1